MMPARIQIDFVRHKRTSNKSGVIIAALGIVASIYVFSEFTTANNEAAVLMLQLPTQRSTRKADPVSGAVGDARKIAAVQQALSELSVPWPGLFEDLERASLDQKEAVALLQIEPDAETGEIRIAAEAASLQTALRYVASLQQSRTLRFPLLDSHEVQLDQRERPVYFEMTAVWDVQ